MTDDSDWDALLAEFGSAAFQEFRPGQRDALTKYSATEATDVAIELPTGYGKTLVGLLIAERHLAAGQSVAYLTGNNFLTDQVIKEAEKLPAFEIARFSGGNYPPASVSAYHSAEQLGVMNFWTYFNSNPKVEPADVIIFDDAHLAEQPLAGMFALRISASEEPELYDAVCDLVLAHTDLYPSIELMRDRASGFGTPPELLAFSDLAAIAQNLGLLLQAHLPEKTRRNVWPRLQPALRACGLLIGPSSIELRPYLPPTQHLRHYSKSVRRVYLSATLGTMEDLQRRLGVSPVTNLLADNPVRLEPVGERLFLLNPGQQVALDDEPADFVLKQSARAGRTAWLCSSHDEADRVEELLSSVSRPSFRLRSGDDSSLRAWQRSPRGHLVTAGRFDGMDFAGDLCRLVVIPSIPAASTEFERFVMAYLGDATYMRHRVGQRITQALGRANRSSDDWAMYIAGGPDFGTVLATSAVQASIPIGVRADVDAALKRIDGGWPAAESAADAFWGSSHVPAEDDGTEAETSSAGSISGTTTARPRPGRRSAASSATSASFEVAAVTRMWVGDFVKGAEFAEKAAAALADAGEVEHAAFWRYVSAQAHFADDSPQRSIDALNDAVFETQNTAWFVRLRKVLASLRKQQVRTGDEEPWNTWDEWLRSAGPAKAVQTAERLTTAWSGSHDQQAEALETLARLAGVTGSRPKGKAVTDAIWTFVSGKRLEERLWEVKTGDADKVPRDWVDQNLGQVSAARSKGGRKHISGCILTHLSEVELEASEAARDQTTIVTIEAIQTLTSELVDRFREYAEIWALGTVNERGQARETVEKRIPSGNWLSELFRPGRLLRRDDVRGVFEVGA